MKKILSVIFLLQLYNFAFTQNINDALRYSFLTYGGSARYMSMSGAFSALGADLSTLSTNPAGIGVSKKSRFEFTPIIFKENMGAEYFGSKTEKENYHVNLNNIGFILNIKPYNESDEFSEWKSIAFGIGYSRLANFYNDVSIKGTNDNSSRLDLFMLNSDGYHPSEISDPEWIAFDTWLIDTIENSDYTYIHELYDNYGEEQIKNIKTKGGVGEFVFTLGGNYADLIQIGATFGIQYLRYIETSDYIENSDYTDLKTFTYTENLKTIGAGYNFKFGIIYRPLDYIRVAAAFHTPTFYELKDIYSYSMSSEFTTADSDGYKSYYSEIEEKEYVYEFYSPMRIILGVAFVGTQYGLLSIDYEYVNYSKARFRSEDYEYEYENNEIKQNLDRAHNLRIGGEIRLAPIFLRAGISYYASPFSQTFNALGSIKSYSLGLGLKTNTSYIDISYNHSFSDYNYLMYDYDTDVNGNVLSEIAKLSRTDDIITFTIGYKF
ncbi:MAG: hypothetical protein JXR51_05770 [Bacteroidales bacterium]|nr:hypothetical protein [Bacteroidales bacterium]MBN2756668.1 hypothetical protein [Bacteroidales bacterium]